MKNKLFLNKKASNKLRIHFYSMNVEYSTFFHFKTTDKK